jgi:hypothetical protein
MPPPRAAFAEPVSPRLIADAIEEFVALHPAAAVVEDGKVVFDLKTAKYELSTEHVRCTLHLWSEERNLVRRVVSVEARGSVLRLATARFGHAQTKLLELVADRERRTPTTREAARKLYVEELQRALVREFAAWKPEGFRAAMDLEESFGPAYARGSLVQGNRAWAVIGAGAHETLTTVDGILSVGVLWLHHCRERAGGKRLYQGLRVVVPRGMAMLTHSRLAWMNTDAAQWELWEMDEGGELTQRDLEDQGNLRTRLVHHPDEEAAAERFAEAVAHIIALVPAGERERVEQRMRGAAEMVFLLHGLEFARARLGFAPNSFAQRVEVSVGVGREETLLTPETRDDLAGHVAELFARRRAVDAAADFSRRGRGPMRRIGATTHRAAHARTPAAMRVAEVRNTQQDPLFRAAPERWLESVLRKDLAPLTRSFAPSAAGARGRVGEFANEVDPDTIGNRADSGAAREAGPSLMAQDDKAWGEQSRAIPRLDPKHVYAQVPAIAGAKDRGLLDLLGVTSDGRLAVIELKADDDLHLAMQGLDYWIRVRHHHAQTVDAATGLGEFQRHGYFRGVELSPLPPRLYLVAPALHIHPATETILRYLSPRVEWHLLALDERWRSQVRVVWRRSGGG